MATTYSTTLSKTLLNTFAYVVLHAFPNNGFAYPRKCFYIMNGLYITETAIIKISLLLQYLRIFKAGTMRWICLSLIITISLWGFAYSFMAWVPCFPVSLAWSIARPPNKCYGYGYENQKAFVRLFESHTALNMTFDLLVFLTPMVLFTEPNLRRKSIMAMAGIFVFGGVYVTPNPSSKRFALSNTELASSSSLSGAYILSSSTAPPHIRTSTSHGGHQFH